MEILAFFCFFLLLLILHCNNFIFRFNLLRCLKTVKFFIHSDFNVALVDVILRESWSSPMKKKLSFKMIFLKEDGMFIEFVRSIKQKFGIKFPSTNFRKDFRKIILWIEELVQADNKQFLLKKLKT